MSSIVLDTNAVLDWLLFDDPWCRALRRGITAGALEWIATPAMREEHFEVVGRKPLARWKPDPTALQRAWDAHCRMRPTPLSTCRTIRCADPDDQMFVDLAFSESAVWLLSRDRALLDLAVVMRPHGVHVMTPAAWVAQHGDGAL